MALVGDKMRYWKCYSTPLDETNSPDEAGAEEGIEIPVLWMLHMPRRLGWVQRESNLSRRRRAKVDNGKVRREDKSAIKVDQSR